MGTPLVSIGISFYNNQETLLESIKSVFAQTYNNWELIMVDDGSTDGSLALARSIDDPRVRLLTPDGKNLRLAARLNQLTRAARGDYIARMDADDLSHPERLVRQLEFFENHPEIDVLGTSMCILDKQGRPAKKYVMPRAHEKIFKTKFVGTLPIIHPSVMAKAKWFRCHPYDEKIQKAQDYELWLRSCKDSVFYNLPDLFCFKDEYLSFSLRKYTKSKRFVTKIIWMHAPSEIGRFRAACYACKKFFEIGVFAIADLLKLNNLLISRRFDPLNSQDRAEVNAALDVIRSTEVPLRNPT